MPHLWVHQRSEWAVLPLERTPLALADVQLAADETFETGGPPATGLLIQTGARERLEWHLLAGVSSGVALNGLPLLTGLRTLVDRDEIRLPGLGRLFFSTERIARVEPLPELDRDIFCPRCRQRIQPGTPAVRCPVCDLWLHQSEDLPCWSYAPTCAFCQQSTDPDAGFRWTPEDH